MSFLRGLLGRQAAVKAAMAAAAGTFTILAIVVVVATSGGARHDRYGALVLRRKYLGSRCSAAELTRSDESHSLSITRTRATRLCSERPGQVRAVNDAHVQYSQSGVGCGCSL